MVPAGIRRPRGRDAWARGVSSSATAVGGKPMTSLDVDRRRAARFPEARLPCRCSSTARQVSQPLWRVSRMHPMSCRGARAVMGHRHLWTCFWPATLALGLPDGCSEVTLDDTCACHDLEESGIEALESLPRHFAEFRYPAVAWATFVILSCRWPKLWMAPARSRTCCGLIIAPPPPLFAAEGHHPQVRPGHLMSLNTTCSSQGGSKLHTQKHTSKTSAYGPSERPPFVPRGPADPLGSS